MSQALNSFRFAATLGIAFSAMFIGGNLCMSNLAVPTLLLPAHPPSSSPQASNIGVTKAAKPASLHEPATPHSHLARQWQNLYNIGSKAGPVAALGSATSFLYAVSRLPAGSTSKQRLLVTAASLSVAIVPFTFIFMLRTNNEIHRRANAANRGEEAEIDNARKSVEGMQTPELITWWSKLNLM